MIHSVRILLIVVLVASPAAAQAPNAGTAKTTSDSGKAGAKSPDYYPLKVGTKWTYQVDAGNGQKQEITTQIGGLEDVGGKSLARLEVIVNGQKIPASEHLISKEDGVYRVKQNNMELNPPLCLLKYPVKAGQEWETQTTAVGQKMEVKSKEGAEEDVQVPAGKYRAIPCKMEITAAGTKFTNTFWFAKDVGMVKQRTEIGPRSFTLEMTKFEAGK